MKKQTGFTILELMTVVAIAGVLLVVAIPSYQNMIKNNCMTTGVNSLVTSLQQARSEAVKRHTTVTLTAGNATDNTNEWGTGWNVTLKEDRNGNGTLETGEDYNGNGTLDNAVLIRSVSLTCNKTTIDETANTTTFTYDATGTVDKTGTFKVCDDRTAEDGREVSLSITGRPNSKVLTQSDPDKCN